MATQPKRQPGKPLPMGLAKSGLDVWHKLSESQQKTAKDFGIFDGEYYTRFCDLMNDSSIQSSIIDKGGVVKGLTHEGKKIWDMLDADVQLEVFLTSGYGTTANVVKFINASWAQFKAGKLTNAQIEHGIQTLANEVEEMITTFLQTMRAKKNSSN